MQKWCMALTIFSLSLISPMAVAHEIHVGDKTIDFKGWKGGSDGKTDCCDNRHCQAALSYTQLTDGTWVFMVKLFPGNPTSPIQRVSVPDAVVTKDNPAEDANAYWCGTFTLEASGKYLHSNLCAFVPRHGS